LQFLSKSDLKVLKLWDVNSSEFDIEFFMNIELNSTMKECHTEIKLVKQSQNTADIYNKFIFGEKFLWKSLKLLDSSLSFQLMR
jgi:hypothetical protein